ncbi:hypothetical protein [Coleofasciculus sp. FACHB-1120]|uniref:hypothetical protein n=1 Tax=Coleofasciculus sp. FACHB-1120 TaxID=2692783 RepID=UPI0016878892|nr:hypothetical protein [Coleofasciculus sp. FACHB-1120]MBD2743965.1 hypothetical protein [Coleofasciculus sp. FACHB-1120]
MSKNRKEFFIKKTDAENALGSDRSISFTHLLIEKKILHLQADEKCRKKEKTDKSA